MSGHINDIGTSKLLVEFSTKKNTAKWTRNSYNWSLLHISHHSRMLH